MHALAATLALALASTPAPGDAAFLEDRFRLPDGFRIYKAASRELSGGSYDLAFDGEGRLLVGDGRRVRRLADTDGDGVFDDFEVIAEGLGPRGPQGLLVYGDRLYAVGGDGIQLFTGYLGDRGSREDGAGGDPDRPALLRHAGRIGAPFHTGGDHAAHTVLRGHDGYIYFITGDGGGARGREHITEETSPALRERAGTVFRISPDGRRWECIGTGARNAPNLGMNYLGELFSLDSDMEWHVDLPWWRPVRLHHWLTGGDQGWQSVGAYPPYFIDNLPGICDVGRGSPDWGVFYEHRQFPERYRNAYLVCDYRWKSATSGGYATVGRLLVFFLEREGAGWNATYEVFATPRDGARDENGRAIDFALVDIEVGPDGSLFLSDHNQGIWRIVYDPAATGDDPPPIVPRAEPLPRDREALLERLVALPQPGSEWSRVRRERIREALGKEYRSGLERFVLERGESLARRLAALRHLSEEFDSLSAAFLEKLARDPLPEIRAQAAWLLGLRGEPQGATFLAEELASDDDPFVRRRALEALSRNRPAPDEVDHLVARLEDPERLVRYAAMIALSHHPKELWLDRALDGEGAQGRLRALVVAAHRRELPERERIRAEVRDLIRSVDLGSPKEDRLDLLRILGLFREELESDPEMRALIRRRLLEDYPPGDEHVRWETVRLIGEYRFGEGFGALLEDLEGEEENVTRFHIAQSLARLPEGWSEEEERRAVDWFLATEEGWFAEYAGKGRQFPHFWATVLADFVRHHPEAFAARIDEVDLSSRLGDVTLDILVSMPGAAERLMDLYREKDDARELERLLGALGHVPDRVVSAFLRGEYRKLRDPRLETAALLALARQPPFAENRPFLEEGLFHEEIDVFRASARALARNSSEPREDIAQVILARMDERRDAFRAGERLLVAVSGTRREGYEEDRDPRRRPDDRERERGLAFWKEWYRETFGTEFRPPSAETVVEKSNEELRRFLLSDEAAGGSVKRGQKIYAELCARCHGAFDGRPSETIIFGPDLAGATRRLTREELADSLVFPSKTVPERFKGMSVQVAGGELLSGFITESGKDAITLVTQEKVHRLSRGDILFVAPQETSLMPDGLLNRLGWEEIRDLLAATEEIGRRPAPEGETEEEEPPSGEPSAASRDAR